MKAALADILPEMGDNKKDDTKTIDVAGHNKDVNTQPSPLMVDRQWSSIKTGLNTRIPEDMKRFLDDLIWARGKETTNNGQGKPQIQDVVTEAIGDLLSKYQALLTKYDLP